MGAELVDSDTKEQLQKSGQEEQVRNPGRLPGGRWIGTKPRATTGRDVGKVVKDSMGVLEGA